MRTASPKFAVTYARPAKGGVAKVYVDGEYQGKMSFRSSDAKPRLGFTRTFTGLGRGTHTVKLVMGRGAGYVDDFLIWGKLVS